MAVQLPYIPPIWRESLAGVEAAALLRSAIWRGEGIVSGDDRPVLLIPGFLAGDGSLGTMAHWLRGNGYRTHRAGTGRRRPRGSGCSTRRAGSAR